MIMIAPLLALILVGILLFYASTKPDSFHYARSVNIKAPADKLFPFVNDLRQWPLWSPFEKMDPKMKKLLSGPPSGSGAGYEWNGNAKAGAGKMEILSSSPSTAILIRLTMLKPMKAINQVTFTFEEQGEATKVTWAMSGQNAFIGKLFSVFVNCDKMCGDQFTEGLSKLKAIAEKN
jgi:hypothetical protein